MIAFQLVYTAINEGLKMLFPVRTVLTLSLLLPLCAFDKSPATDVLVGTDTRKLESYKFTKKALTPGVYVAETGGAKTTLTIRKLSEGTFDVTRTFAEPGERPRTKTYRRVQRGADGGYRLARSLEIRVPEGGGILVLELASGVESIPDSLWVWFASNVGGGKK